MIYLGNTRIADIHLGSTPVKAVYLGNNKVWPSLVIDNYKYENIRIVYSNSSSYITAGGANYARVIGNLNGYNGDTFVETVVTDAVAIIDMLYPSTPFTHSNGKITASSRGTVEGPTITASVFGHYTYNGTNYSYTDSIIVTQEANTKSASPQTIYQAMFTPISFGSGGQVVSGVNYSCMVSATSALGYKFTSGSIEKDPSSEWADTNGVLVISELDEEGGSEIRVLDNSRTYFGSQNFSNVQIPALPSGVTSRWIRVKATAGDTWNGRDYLQVG